MNSSIKAVLSICMMLHISQMALGQTTETPKSTLDFSGSISANSNGFSFIPTFSLGKPAVQTGFNITGNKNRFSFQPQFWYSMLDYKPWSFIFIWRYKMVKTDKFDLTLGTHAPAINFRSATVVENGVDKDVIKARRFYPAVEILPVYKIKKNIALSMYFLFGTGIEKEVSSKNYFLSLRPDFNRIPLTNKLYLRLNPQFYYLRIDDLDGFYTAANLTLAHDKLPFTIGTMVNREIKSDINTKDFEWNVSLNYAFGKRFVER